MNNAVRDAVSELQNLFNSRSASGTSTEDIQRAKDYFHWVKAKSNLITNEKSFAVPSNIEVVQGMRTLRAPSSPGKTLVQRGSVLWMDFGENIGQEFSGRHPGLILKIGGETAIVVPLSSQTPTPAQIASKVYVRVDHVHNFTPMTRWGNVLNTTAISLQRFHFNKVGGVKGEVLDAVKQAMRDSRVFGT